MSKSARVPAAFAGCIAVVLVVAGCAGGGRDTGEAVAEPSAAAAAPAGPIPAGLEEFYTQQVQWGSCEGYSTDGSPLGDTLVCAKVTVPNDYANPGGATAQIAVSRSKATGDKVGSLLVNPGGPGASGIGLASVADGTDIAERFDVIGFDPRGVGASTPQVTCLTPPEVDARRKDDDVDMSPAGIAQTEAENREYADKCAERTGVDVLAHVGTYDVVRDMDVIRAVLGDEKLNYLGYSYGTRLGSTYAETFPGNVRAMVLDGALDPEQDPTEEVILQAAGFQSAFDAFAAECMQQPDCPLGTDPAQANARFRALVDPLIAKPAATTDPRGLSYTDAITGVQQALYSPNLWGPLRGGLESLQTGTGDSLLMLADLYEGRADDGTYSNLNDAFNSIRCMDDPPVTDRAAVGEADVRYRQAAPFLDDGRGTGSAPLDVCAFWPAPNTGSPHTVSAPGIPPVVVVSTTEDPATPYQAGVDLAKQMNGSLVTYRGTQHTVVLDGEACVDDAVSDYLVDLAAPPADLTC
ncbi:alpha/beta hydrolase [Rhodococcus opacus]|uniref:alpha/beta hydrolase n=1 Tax=Rhodococcus opacus TaxID=37919 RepID=UPI001FF4B45B|nr:alpha/beta hydrolase [Rhodococcus opacus]UOT01918.1 alpha/beta hydrolase [Rhodococcus opacus]